MTIHELSRSQVAAILRDEETPSYLQHPQRSVKFICVSCFCSQHIDNVRGNGQAEEILSEQYRWFRSPVGYICSECAKQLEGGFDPV